MRPAPSSSSPVNRGRPTKSSGSASGHETTRNTCQRHYVRRCSVNLESIPSKLEATSAVLRQQPCKLNPCPIVCYVLVLTKGQGKETWALPKNLATALDNYLAKEGCLEDPFSKQILWNYQPCVSTPKTPEQHKECVNQQNTVYHKFCPRFLSCSFEGTSH